MTVCAVSNQIIFCASGHTVLICTNRNRELSFSSQGRDGLLSATPGRRSTVLSRRALASRHINFR